jgi:hypothetical protein
VGDWSAGCSLRSVVVGGIGDKGWDVGSWSFVGGYGGDGVGRRLFPHAFTVCSEFAFAGQGSFGGSVALFAFCKLDTDRSKEGLEVCV